MTHSAIWYRHWLEIRLLLPVLVVGAVLAGLWPGSTLTGMGPSGGPRGEITRTTSFEHTGQRFQEVQQTPLGRSLNSQELFVWAVFTERISAVVAVILGSLLSGTGLAYILPGPVYYSLTLPVSRSRLLGTRLVVNCVVAVLAAVLTLSTECLVLAIQGRGVPFVPLALSVAFTIPIVFAWAATMGAITMLFRMWWAIWAIIPVIAIYTSSTSFLWSMVTAFPARGEMPWLSLTAVLAIAGVGFGTTLLAGRTREF